MSKLVFNIFFIKSTNGLYYYGLDTVLSLNKPLLTVLVRPSLVNIVRDALPGARIVSCNFLTFSYEIFTAWRSDTLIYTPSSHPLPFINNQIVVLHDTYPFTSWKGWVKKILFIASACSSNCLLSFINRADSLRFYVKHGFDSKRLIYSPNRFTGKITQYRSLRSQADNRLIVGLVGTESSKKKYENIFQVVERYGYSSNVKFLIFGHLNFYIMELKSQFTSLDISIVDSDTVKMADFLGSVDAIVSIAKSEGFGRPIASALESGIPCYLIENKIFREFFEGGAFFSSDVFSLIKSLFHDWTFNGLKSVNFEPNEDLKISFNNSINRIDRICSK